MECKFASANPLTSLVIELIDTLWNVNETYCLVPRPQSIELIDTLWNVNVFFKSCYKINFSRINRYIMECK